MSQAIAIEVGADPAGRAFPADAALPRPVPTVERDPGALDLSIAIATYNRAKTLRRSLESLAHVEHEGVRWEVVVVDNGSRDNTQDVVRVFNGRLPIRYAYEPRPGKSHALNRVAPELRGRLILFTDDDVIFSEDWLKKALRTAAQYPNVDVFGGRVLAEWSRPPTAAYLDHPFAAEAHSLGNFSDDVLEYSGDHFPLGINTLYRRSVLGAVPFNPRLGPIRNNRLIGNDTDLARRTTASGSCMLHVPGLRVRHVIQPDQMLPPYLWRRAYLKSRTLALTGKIASVPTLAGVPVWLLGDLFKAGFRVLANWAGLMPGHRIYAEVDFAGALGWVVGAYERRRTGDQP